MKIRYILSLLTVAFLLGSCATPKVAYFTDLKRGTAEQVLNPLEIRIRPEDKISIQVNSKDPLLMNLFNQFRITADSPDDAIPQTVIGQGDTKITPLQSCPRLQTTAS